MNITAVEAYKKANEAALRLEIPYRKAAEEFIEDVVEPTIDEACASGKFEVSIRLEENPGEYFIGGAIRILQENGFVAKMENDNILWIEWVPN